ncbi:hypothetical protein PV05_01836 [Exophiala xenobiotica]|uniref:F-box domain-containing protein n=1 Tax=Exophiala xenobiotica TaxID=348802 RepID=A0A0D2C9T0_9EURO|nr:uncharacterized protein PV05_01836 [Exophiala xenobiotica]KIW61751.1 hypothetical protein PV05_01836 [Exophiala xenobiotica]
MFRAFLRIKVCMLDNHPPSKNKRVSTTTRFLDLPAEILDIIFDDLDILDRCSLALCCRQLCRIAWSNEHLEYSLIEPPSIRSLQYFFQCQLGRGWIPDTLRYCPDCGKFASTTQVQWRAISEKQTREMSGRVSRLWRARREDGWLRYWIDRWCMDEFDRPDKVTMTLLQQDPTTPVCPKCAMQSTEGNRWRLKKSRHLCG